MAGSLFALFGSSWQFLNASSAHIEAQERGYSNCTASALKSGGNLSYDYCREIWLDNQSSYDFEYWLIGLASYALMALAIYIIIAILAWLAKWIWRGRSV